LCYSSSRYQGYEAMTWVLVGGGRDYTDKAALWSVLDAVGPPEITAIISGMARGADSLAAEWAIRFGFLLHKFPADWAKHGRFAGPIRNQEMIDEGKPDLVIAFAGGKGTADMVRRARLAGIKVMEIKP
jgi:YspA, cpYpsA-related SLOG family